MRSILAWAILLAIATVGAQGMLPERSSGGWEQLSPERREIALVNQLGTMSLATETATLIRSGDRNGVSRGIRYYFTRMPRPLRIGGRRRSLTSDRSRQRRPSFFGL